MQSLYLSTLENFLFTPFKVSSLRDSNPMRIPEHPLLLAASISSSSKGASAVPFPAHFIFNFSISFINFKEYSLG